MPIDSVGTEEPKGLTVEVRNASGELVEGTSFPSNLALLAHQQGTCGAFCGHCYWEASEWVNNA